MIYQKVDTGISEILIFLQAIQYINIELIFRHFDMFDISKHQYQSSQT